MRTGLVKSIAPRGLSRFWRDTRAAAAAEFALCLTMLALPICNVIDLGFYTYERMQVEAAANAAVAAAWHTCSTSAQVPTVNCSGVASTMLTAAQSTSLSTNVTLPAASITEGFYCSNGSGALVQVGSSGSTSTAPTAPSPNNCSTVIANSKTVPGDYVLATASATYTPLFGNATLLSLPSPITRTAWMRLDK